MPRPKPEEEQILISLWLNKSLVAKADKAARKDKFPNRSAFVREAIINEVDARLPEKVK